MDHYTMKALWIYWARGNDEVELTDKESSDSDDEDEVAKIFRIETNVFDFETPLQYKDDWIYEGNKYVPWVHERPWTENGVWKEPTPVKHHCKPFNYKSGYSKWPTCRWREDGYCNEGNLLGAYEDDSKQQMSHESDNDMEYDPSDVEFTEWIASKFFNYKIMDHYTMKALWIYWARGNDEVELTDKESSDSDDEDEVAKIFRIETNVFDFETPLCVADKLKKWKSDDVDQDEGPTARSDRGLKRQRTRKGTETSKKMSTSKDSS
nr:C2 calcium/lipid-binding domain, CaLB [Tanacetum cinerariifolium]